MYILLTIRGFGRSGYLIDAALVLCAATARSQLEPQPPKGGESSLFVGVAWRLMGGYEWGLQVWCHKHKPYTIGGLITLLITTHDPPSRILAYVA